ncbi:MAG: CIA30 family protein [Rhodothermales bacterium]|nr:CIA30 family protein [Rhodothermales bacterium]MBO6779414.1 CIA30 family protein [Rhodothermales bacterium]
MRLALITFFAAGFFSLTTGAQSPSPEMPATNLFDFESESEARWQVVNDGVMGGRSRGYVAVEDGALRFTGVLVTRGGGFTSIRTRASADLGGFDGIELLVRGSGRTFELEVSDGTRWRGRAVSRRASFPTSSEWQWVRVPFSSLQASVFGRPVNPSPIDPAGIRGFGLYIADGIDGAFGLEVDSIRAYRD